MLPIDRLRSRGGKSGAASDVEEMLLFIV